MSSSYPTAFCRMKSHHEVQLTPCEILNYRVHFNTALSQQRNTEELQCYLVSPHLHSSPLKKSDFSLITRSLVTLLFKYSHTKILLVVQSLIEKKIKLSWIHEICYIGLYEMVKKMFCHFNHMIF